MSETRWTPNLWWAAPAATVIVLVVLAMVLGGQEQRTPQSSYDATPKGIRAAYLLLDELRYPVTRSKRATGGAARLVLFPTYTKKDVNVLGQWVRDGGTLVLADDSATFAEGLGIRLGIDGGLGDREEAASGLGAAQLVGGPTRVRWVGQEGRVEAQAGGEPFVTAYRFGRGEVWLLNRPEFVRNRLLSKADNAVLWCRLAEAVLEGKSGRLAFDEYFHGMRERPGVTELLLQPPAVWVTLQGLLLMGLLLWYAVPRFGRARPDTQVRRRSKEEFLEAMASLLERQGDYTEAFRTARDDLVREISQDLGLPVGMPDDQVAREAARRRRLRPEVFLQAVRPPALVRGLGRDGFIKAMNDLETVRDEFFNGRPHR